MGKIRNQEQFDYSNFKRPQLNLKRDTRKGVAIVFFVVLAILFTLSLTSLAGPFGTVANQVLKLAFGWVAYFVPVIFLVVAVALFRQKPEEEASTVSTHAYVGAVLLTLTLTGLLHLWEISDDVNLAFSIVKDGRGGGYLGVLTSYPLMRFMGFIASLVIFLAGIIISMLVTFNVSFADLWKKKSEADKRKLLNGKLKINNGGNVGFTKETIGETNKAATRSRNEVAVNNLDELKLAKRMKVAPPPSDKDWKFPALDLLDDAKQKVDSGNIEANVSIIQKTLNDFGIDVEMGEVNVGPTVTQYTFRPAVGVKLSQIAGLQNDLALALAASSIRMELPIPGKALVGVEIPNKSAAVVRVKDIIGNAALSENPSKVAF